MMDDQYKIVFIEKPGESVWGIIGKGIRNFNLQHAGEKNSKRLCFAILTPTQEIFGGVLGEISWDWLHIDLMWIKDELRGHGFGHRLLLAIEDEARRQGAKNAFLDTFSFQAPEFYKQHGYRVFGELSGFPSGYQRIFLTKGL
ncbi:MAG: GNAT family N-acetyltransferase [Anaerolineales bacterium]|nr:GNAT family N-acetyltransferase [Anaerolineales bacterium]